MIGGDEVKNHWTSQQKAKQSDWVALLNDVFVAFTHLTLIVSHDTQHIHYD